MSTAAEETRARFDGIPPEHRWTESLDKLWVMIRPAAFRAQGAYVWYMLPNGACVALKKREDMRFELRISREKQPKDVRGLNAWDNENNTFLKYFQSGIRADEWLRVGDDDTSKGIARIYLQLWPGEIGINRIKCTCGREAPRDKMHPFLCETCIMREMRGRR